MSLTVSSIGAMSFLSAINYHKKDIGLCHPFPLAKLSVAFLWPASKLHYNATELKMYGTDIKEKKFT